MIANANAAALQAQPEPVARPFGGGPADGVVAAFLERDAAFVIASSGQADDAWLELRSAGSPAAVIGPADLGRLGIETINRFGVCESEEWWARWCVGDGDHASAVQVDITPEWALPEEHTAYLFSRAGQSEPVQKAVRPCAPEVELVTAWPGEVYSFSALCATHRASGRVALLFYGAAGLIQQASEEIPPQHKGGRRPEDYALVVVKAFAPPGTTHLRVEITKDPTREGADSFLFFARPVLRRGTVRPTPSLLAEVPAAVGRQVFALQTPHVHVLPLQWHDPRSSDGETHLELIDRVSARQLWCGAVQLGPDAPFRVEEVSIEGATLVAKVEVVATWLVQLELTLWVDGSPVGEFRFDSPCRGDTLKLSLPVRTLDGRLHLFQVRMTSGGRLVGQCAAVAPDTLTSWGALSAQNAQAVARAREPASEQRYLALSRALASLLPGAELQPNLDRLRNVALAHDVLQSGFLGRGENYARLHIPVSETPHVSIVVPVHNKFAVTYNCLASIVLAASALPFEVVVVDDGSSDWTRDLEKIVPGVRCVRLPLAGGFVGACNAGAAVARGDLIVFLNNDTEVTVGWLDELARTFSLFPGVGLAGSKLVYPDGRLQDAGGIVWDSGDPWNYGRGENPREPRFCYTRQVDYLTGAALMVSRDAWLEVGGFSKEFAPAYFEDTDLAFKVRAAGFRVVYNPLSLVYHYEGQSNGTDLSDPGGLKRFQEINRPKFKARWSRDFRNKGRLGEAVDLIKDRGIVGRVVFFDIDLPKWDQTAGGYAALQEIRIFQSLGFKVTFVPITLAYFGRYTEDLQRIGVEVIHAPFYDSVEDFIVDRGSEFDLAYVTRFQVVSRVAPALRRDAPTVPIVGNVADLHSLRHLREAIAEGRDADIAAAHRLRDQELAELAKVDLVLTYSEVEREIIQTSLGPKAKVDLLPWVVTPDPKPPVSEGRDGLVFVGSFEHSPNRAAVEFFVREIMPSLRVEIPGVTLRIYGSNPPQALLRLSCPDVTFEGYAPSIERVFADARVSVAPLTYGAGIKGKVLDALAAGIPSVLSPVAAEGLPIQDGVEALIAADPSSWIAAIRRLIEDDRYWAAMSEAALALAASRFSFQAGQEMVSASLQRLGLSPARASEGMHPLQARPAGPPVAP